MEISKLLKHVFLFNRLNEEEILKISSVSTLIKKQKNEQVFQEGEPANAFFVVVYGSLKIFKITAEGSEITLHIQKAADLVAEAAIFDNEIYPSYCKAIEDSLLIRVPKESFISFINQTPSIALKMLAAYSKRLRAFVNTIENMNSSDIKQRMAQYFLEHAVNSEGKYILMLDITKKQLASLLGTTPETVSRTISTFKKQRVISETGKKIIINQPERLKKIFLQNP